MAELDCWGRNILFYNEASDEEKKLLVEKFPHSLECVDYDELNILFFDTVGDYWKQKLIELFPHALEHVDFYGQNILFYDTIKDCYKQKLIELFPHSLACVDNQERNILFYDTIKDCYKQKLIELFPHALEQVDIEGLGPKFKPIEITKATKLGDTCYICLCDFEIGENITNLACFHNTHKECYENMKKHGRFKCYCEKI